MNLPDLPPLPDLPSLPDAVLSAVIAGAFALVTQALVKVWEVRQKRMDTVALVYADRVRTLRDFGIARRRHMRAARHIVDLKRKRDEGANVDARLKTARREWESATEKKAVAGEELRKHAHLARLYSRPPLVAQSKKLSEVVGDLKDDSDMKAFNRAVERWERVARWELASIGSIGTSLILYSFYSWGYSLKSASVSFGQGVWRVAKSGCVFDRWVWSHTIGRLPLRGDSESPSGASPPPQTMNPRLKLRRGGSTGPNPAAEDGEDAPSTTAS